MRWLLALALLPAPLMAQTRAELCAASAYNFDVALTLKAQGFSRAEAEANILGLYDGAENAYSRAVPDVVATAWRFDGAPGPAAEAAYLQACVTQ